MVDLAENLWFGNTVQGTLLPGKALHNGIKIKFKYEDNLNIK
jgi:hypothetical protein